MNKLNILWLWPDILNLHGDRGGAMALARICALYGIETKITRVNRLTDAFDIACADIALLGAGELAVMPEITAALSKQADALSSYAESGGMLLATGTTGAALGRKTTRIDGTAFQGLGLLDMDCQERETPLGDDLVFRARFGGEADINCGIQIQMMDIALAENQPPFGETVYGYGNDGGGAEGAARGGVIFTNALGPLLAKNPWLTLDLINRALMRKDRGMTEDALKFRPELFAYELASREAIQKFNETKQKGAHQKT